MRKEKMGGWKSFEEHLEKIKEEMEEWLEKTNEELLTLNKEGLPDWDQWFKRGKGVVCGVQLTNFLTLYRKQSEKCVRPLAIGLLPKWS